MTTGPVLQGVAALIAATGGIGIFFLKVWSDRHDEQRRREERVDDLVRALHADIAIERERLHAVFALENAAVIRPELIGNIVQNEPRPMPITSSGAPSFVLESLKADLSLLPSAGIEPVIRFYRLVQGVAALEESFATGAYNDISSNRQAIAIEGYFANGLNTLSAADQALAALGQHLKEPPTSGFAFRRKSRDG